MATVVVCSVGVGLGLIGLVVAGRESGTTSKDRAPKISIPFAAWSGRPKSPESEQASHRWMGKAAAAFVTALVVGTVTRWPVAALLGAVAALTLPSMLRSTSLQDATRRTEAIAVWTELLRDTLTASAGLAQAIVASAEVAPAEIRVPVSHLADRVMSGVSMDEALRLFAEEIDSASAQQVIYALRLAATSRAQKLVELLSALAEATRDEVTMLLRVEASRASARSGVRTVICFSIGFVALLTVAARSYLSPFGSAAGQLVLLLVGAFYAAGLVLMVRLVRARSDGHVLRGAVGP
jgi:tight adherence protein B